MSEAEESDQDRLKWNFNELLQELRVVQAGIQIQHSGDERDTVPDNGVARGCGLLRRRVEEQHRGRTEAGEQIGLAHDDECEHTDRGEHGEAGREDPESTAPPGHVAGPWQHGCRPRCGGVVREPAA
jgi:hypothetical protein